MTTILITPALVQALRAWNSDIARARHEYETTPSRACRWNTYDKPCWTPPPRRPDLLQQAPGRRGQEGRQEGRVATDGPGATEGCGMSEREKAHAVTITFEQGDYWPTLRFTCQAPEGAICRTVCRNEECEEGCYSIGEPEHERVAVDYCNTVEWFENTDDVAGDIFGGRTSITAPILVDWSRGEDGPDWRLAEDGPIE